MATKGFASVVYQFNKQNWSLTSKMFSSRQIAILETNNCPSHCRENNFSRHPNLATIIILSKKEIQVKLFMFTLSLISSLHQFYSACHFNLSVDEQ